MHIYVLAFFGAERIGRNKQVWKFRLGPRCRRYPLLLTRGLVRTNSRLVKGASEYRNKLRSLLDSYSLSIIAQTSQFQPSPPVSFPHSELLATVIASVLAPFSRLIAFLCLQSSLHVYHKCSPEVAGREKQIYELTGLLEKQRRQGRSQRPQN